MRKWSGDVFGLFELFYFASRPHCLEKKSTHSKENIYVFNIAASEVYITKTAPPFLRKELAIADLYSVLVIVAPPRFFSGVRGRLCQ